MYKKLSLNSDNFYLRYFLGGDDVDKLSQFH